MVFRTMTLITPEQRDLYHTEGYMILLGVIPPDMLTMPSQGVFLFSRLQGFSDG